MKAAKYLTTSLAATLIASSAIAQAPFRVDPLQNALQRGPQQMMPNLPTSIYRLRPGGVANLQISQRVISALKAQEVADAIKNRFEGKAVGYAITVKTTNGATGNAAGGFARRQPPDTDGRAMSTTERITIASVSKTITAASLLKSLAAKNISLDAAIWEYLPSDWTFGNHFKTITFRQLLNHTSGIRNCGINFDQLKECAATGISLSNKTFQYSNANYALMRVLIPRMLGATTPTAEGYASSYIAWVNRQVLQPAGIPTAACKPTSSTPALSYESATSNPVDFSSVKSGEIWGDMTLVCGSQGWNLSAQDLATFMHALMFTNKILPQSTVDEMKAGNLGMFWRDFGNGLEGWNHGGWHPYNWPGNQGEINTLVLTLNNGLTIGVVINSNYNGDYMSDIIAAVRSVQL